MRVLVTGAAGFIGYHVAARCLAEGHAVLGVDNLDPYYAVALKEARLRRLQVMPGFAFARLDLVDARPFRDVMSDFAPEVVVHLAAQAGVRHSLEAPQAYVEANVTGFLTVLEACRSRPVRHLVYASSSSVYGLDASAPFSERDRADQPVSLYAATKRANELMAHAYAHLFAIPAMGLRFFTVYGPWGRPDMMYYAFTRAILQGEPIGLYNEGRMERDFTYVDDVVDAVLPLLSRPPEAGPGAPHRVCNVGNGTPVPLERFVQAIEAATGRRAKRRLLPMQPGDVPRTCASTEALAAVVGVAPHTDVETGVRRFVEWYRRFERRLRPVPDSVPAPLPAA